MARRLASIYGVEGEFYVAGGGESFDEYDPSVIDRNRPPRTQPGLWCKWTPNEEGTALVWNQVEKFYDYDAWLQYIVDTILAPRGYLLTGRVGWQGQDRRDFGQITVKANVITVQEGVRMRPRRPLTKNPKSLKAADKEWLAMTSRLVEIYKRKLRREGAAEGRAEGKAEDLFAILAARRLTPTATQRRRIESCSDTAQLDRWIRRALRVEKITEVFAASSGRSSRPRRRSA